ncbi:MAG: VWA domain-containing protein [Mycobacteriaceae bacterium]|nr:VWA domain-containing protein [Mycobacteriaceae bacterium]
MAARRTRPPQPLAPHGLTGHLVGFVEALRAQGIAVGPSETVDAGQALAVLGLGSREALREGLACAVLRRADHRQTYDALFELWWPAALGGRTVLDDGPGGGEGVPLDVEAMRSMLLDLLIDNPDISDLDERLVAVIASIVEAHGRYTSSRGPSYSSYQALKAMSLDQLEGRLLAGLLAPHGDDPSPATEQIAKATAARKIAQLRRMVESETKRRTAEQLGRDHVQMYGIPQLAENVEFLRASGDQLRQMRRVVAPLARMLATRLAARRRRARAGSVDLRRTLRKSMSTGGVPIDMVLRKPRPARPEPENFPEVLSPRSSLLVLGDGRTNYRNPATDVLARMVTASRHAHWLNPEPRHLWGSGDSAVPRYEDIITIHECRSAKQLAAVIDRLLPV